MIATIAYFTSADTIFNYSIVCIIITAVQLATVKYQTSAPNWV